MIATSSPNTKLKLPRPYPLQSEILLSPAMRKVIASGRQVGKTMTASMSAIGGKGYGGRGLLDGAHVHISSTTQDQSDLFWDYITDWLAPLFDMPGFYKNEGRRIIQYRGGRIRVKTGKNPDALRGGNVDKLILDECAYLDPKAALFQIHIGEIIHPLGKQYGILLARFRIVVDPFIEYGLLRFKMTL